MIFAQYSPKLLKALLYVLRLSQNIKRYEKNVPKLLIFDN